jgi:hypothetical protein
MGELKRFLKNIEITVNESIVLVQSEIDELFEEHLNNPFKNNKVEMELKTNRKNYYYGHLGAIKSVSEKIKEIEESDMLEFELAFEELEQLSMSERELKADV